MKNLFITDDGRPYAEPLIVVLAVVFDVVFGRNPFLSLFGWWLFLVVATNMPGHVYAALLMRVRGRKECMDKFPDMMESILHHRSFLFVFWYAVFLHYWWRWI